MAKKFTQTDAAKAQQLSRSLLSLHTELFALGLTKTAGELGRAMDAIGWEISERMGSAGLVSRDEQRRQDWHAKMAEKNAA